MDYPTLLPLYINRNRNIPLSKTWRYNQRQNIRKYHTLDDISKYCHKQYIPSIQKDICLQELMVFIENRIQNIISQRYQLAFLIYTHNIPNDIIRHICTYTHPIL